MKTAYVIISIPDYITFSMAVPAHYHIKPIVQYMVQEYIRQHWAYVICLKENSTLRALASEIEERLTDTTRHDMISYAVCYGGFLYKAGTWKYPHRVVCKVEKPTDQLIHRYTFIVTNMDSAPEELVRFYCKRGSMENFIKESKNGFVFTAVSSSSKIVNVNRLQIHALAYNIFHWLKRLVLPAKMRR